MNKCKKVISHVLIIAMLVTTMSVGAQIISFSDNEAHAIELTNKKIYYVKGYKSGNCVVSSNTMMLRRAAIQSGSRWKGITLSSVKKKATLGGSLMKWKYTYKYNGMKYTVKAGWLHGSATKKRAKLKKLLKAHPEGVVIYGASSSGPHAVLAIEYKGKVLYVAEPNFNCKGKNKGITTFKKSSMKSVRRLSMYWYISKKSGTPKNKYFTVKFYADGGKGTMRSMKVRLFDGRSLDKNAFKYRGHKFMGWNIKRTSDQKWLYKKPGTKYKAWFLKDKQPKGWVLLKFKNKQKISHPTSVNKDTIRMHAVWN